MLLGCIADDFTGATDLANMLVRGGMRTIQTIGIPRHPLPRRWTRWWWRSSRAPFPQRTPSRSRWRRSPG